MSTLHRIVDALKTLRRPLAMPYLVPSLWVDGKTPTKQAVDPYRFYARRIQDILDTPPEPLIRGQDGQPWSERALVYNLFPRVTAAFSHADDGKIRVEPRPDGWRDTGTLLKAICLLPYIKGMGFNTVHLLPITAVGQDGKKGTLGSPYAIRNPYLLDDRLAEPALGMGPEMLFMAFVEAAHHLGLRVVMEFVLRTAAKDADWIAEHPDWFYWVKAEIPDRAPGSADPGAYGMPLYDGRTLGLIKGKVAAGDFYNLPAPPDAHRAMFTAPPAPDRIVKEDGRWIGTLADGTRVRVPGAFTDWPPDDNQPPWSDVTYLRLYTHPDFNYIAYNTVRMYDPALTQPQHINEALWDAIAGVVPHYQREYAIDGIMLDMGHALPMDLKRRIVQEAHRFNPEFAFWEENFDISEASRNEGYSAVMGYMVLAMHDMEGLRYFVNRWAMEPVPIPFFATAENHNTPRAAARAGNGRIYSYYTLPLCIAMPGIPFVHSGFELAETQPINTGLGFSNEMLARYPADKLPLFSEWAYNWTNPDNMVEGVRYALALRRKYEALLASKDPATWYMGHSPNPSLLVFTRRCNGQSLTFIANMDMTRHQRGRVLLGGTQLDVKGVWGSPDALPVHHGLTMDVELSPGYVLVLEGDHLPLDGCE